MIGARVRITGPTVPMGEMIGTLTRVAGDTLTIDAQAFLRKSLTSIELSNGSESHLFAGTGIGLLVGGLVGAIVLHHGIGADSDQCTGTCGPLSGAVVGAGAGAGIGALLGALIRTERWIPFDYLHLGMQPRARGMLRVSVVIPL